MNSNIQYNFTDVSYVFNDNVDDRDSSSEFGKAVNDIREAIVLNMENLEQLRMTSTPRISDRGEGVMQDHIIDLTLKETIEIDENLGESLDDHLASSSSNTSDSSLSSLFDSVSSEDSTTTEESSLTLVSNLSVESWLQAIDCFDSSASLSSSDSYINDLSSNTSLFTSGEDEGSLLDESSPALTSAESLFILQELCLTGLEVNFQDNKCLPLCEVVKNVLDVAELSSEKELKPENSSHSDTSQADVTPVFATVKTESCVKVDVPSSPSTNENEKVPLKLKAAGIKIDLARYALFELVDKVMRMSEAETTELRFRTLSYYYSKQTELGKRETLLKQKLREITGKRPFYARLIPCFRKDDAYAETSHELEHVRAVMAEAKKQISLWKTIFRFRSDGVSTRGLLKMCKLHIGERLRRAFRR